MIFAPVPAIVKPADVSPAAIESAFIAAWLADSTAALPAGDLIDEPWPLSDADADWLADRWAADAAIESGAWAW